MLGERHLLGETFLWHGFELYFYFFGCQICGRIRQHLHVGGVDHHRGLAVQPALAQHAKSGRAVNFGAFFLFPQWVQCFGEFL